MNNQGKIIPISGKDVLVPPLVNATQGLMDIDNTSDASRAEFLGVQEVLHMMEAKNLTSRFGITLLHKHFDVADDEIMIETCDTKKRTLLIRPIKKTILAKMPVEVRQTQWRGDVEGIGLGCSVVCTNTGQGHSPSHIPKIGFPFLQGKITRGIAQVSSFIFKPFAKKGKRRA